MRYHIAQDAVIQLLPGLPPFKSYAYGSSFLLDHGYSAVRFLFESPAADFYFLLFFMLLL